MFEARRQRLLEAMGPDSVLLLLGAGLATRSADTHFPFRQDSDFHYVTGFDHPNAAALLRTDGGPGFTLFVEPRDPDAETWTGFRPGVEGARSDFGADEAHPISELADHLTKLLGKARRIHHVLGRDSAIDRTLVDTIESMRLRSRAGLVPPAEIVDPRSILHEMRLLKEPGELDIMRRAAAISHEAHGAGAARMRPGVFEYEIEAAIDYTFRRRGAAGPAYTTIVGSGRNATVLHYITNDQKLAEGDMVLVDAGCELEGYASDVTRTYPVGGHYAGAGRAVYDVVLSAQLAAIDQARPGATLEEVHERALRRLVEGLKDLGILEGEVDGLIEGKAFLPYYMHRTSHWLGLDVHDVGSYTQDGGPRPLEPGMVFTIEPGLYISSGAEADPRFHGIGVRIEDDVVVTPEGCENLTEAIPKHPADVEAWMSAGD